jgi:hypothetical protein
MTAPWAHSVHHLVPGLKVVRSMLVVECASVREGLLCLRTVHLTRSTPTPGSYRRGSTRRKGSQAWRKAIFYEQALRVLEISVSA